MLDALRRYLPACLLLLSAAGVSAQTVSRVYVRQVPGSTFTTSRLPEGDTRLRFAAQEHCWTGDWHSGGPTSLPSALPISTPTQ